MSSFPTVPTSTIVSSSNCRSRSEIRSRPGVQAPLEAPTRPEVRSGGAGQRPTTAVIACGALGAQLRQIIRRRGFAVELHCLPPLLHNRPERISAEVERLARRLLASHARVVVAYADCGTYGALDRVCESLHLRRLPGLHCYDVLAGPDRIRQIFDEEPGTYLLTDFLVSSFRRTVLAELGLDRHPELWPDYFGHYHRVVWLAGSPTPELTAEAAAIAEMFGLPLSVVVTGSSALELELERLLDRAGEGQTVTDHAGPGQTVVDQDVVTPVAMRVAGESVLREATS